MNIGINCYPTHGGSGVVATELAKALSRRGHNVSIISYDLPFRLDELNDDVSYYEVYVEKYPLMKYFPYTLALSTKMIEVVKERNLDIIHAHYAIPHSIAAILAKDILQGERDVKIVTTLHGTDITLVGNNASFKPMTTYAIKRSDGVTAVSRALKEATCRHFDVDCNKIDVIYNFFTPEPYITTIPKCVKAHHHKKRFIAVHISNFRPVKRVTDTIKAFYHIWKELPACLLMIGDGPDKSEAMKLVKELGMEENVHFLGVIKNIVPIIQSSNLMFLTSENESFGLVLLEAMGCGIPVVATNVGGIPEVVEHGVTGYLAPVGDTEALGKYGLEILRNEELHEKMGKAGYKRVVEHFHTDYIVSQYEKLYERIMEK